MGYETNSHGWVDPLIIKGGHLIPIKATKSAFQMEIGAVLPNGEYELLKDERDAFRATFKNGALESLGSMKRATGPSEQRIVMKPANAALLKLFPVPAGSEDTVSVAGVYWHPSIQGISFGNVEFRQGGHFSYESAVRTASGKVFRLDKIVPALRNYRAGEIIRVDRKGWLVVAADATKGPNANRMGVGTGREIFWIEIKSKKR